MDNACFSARLAIFPKLSSLCYLSYAKFAMIQQPTIGQLPVIINHLQDLVVHRDEAGTCSPFFRIFIQKRILMRMDDDCKNDEDKADDA